jgi:hypothetical protein
MLPRFSCEHGNVRRSEGRVTSRGASNCAAELGGICGERTGAYSIKANIYGVVLTGGKVRTFRRNFLPPSSTLNLRLQVSPSKRSCPYTSLHDVTLLIVTSSDRWDHKDTSNKVI